MPTSRAAQAAEITAEMLATCRKLLSELGQAAIRQRQRKRLQQHFMDANMKYCAMKDPTVLAAEMAESSAAKHAQ
jgi:hypothetical protein